MTVTMSVAMTLAVRLVGTRIDSNKAARRLLRGLGVCMCMCMRMRMRMRLSCMTRAAVHQCDIGRAQRTNWGGWARGCSAVKNGLLAPLKPMVELSCTSSNWEN